jgi:hypothetical protein
LLPLLAKVPLAPPPGAAKVIVMPVSWPVSGQPFVLASLT